MVDQEIAEKIEAVQPGQYTRVSQLLEKVVYGDILLERYKERTVRKLQQQMLPVTGE